MGLSDEERFLKIAFACRSLYKTADELANCDDYDKFATLHKLCKDVWFAFIGNTSNSAHWLLGSSAGNIITKPDGLWPAAIIEALHRARPSDDPEFDETLQEEFDKFDALDVLDVTSLLRQEHYKGTELAATFEIFAWTEQLTYALRRYDDKFLAGLERLSKQIAEIQGVCFEIFTSFDEQFARAYLVREICEKLYANKKFREIAEKQSWCHHLSKPMRERTELSKLLKHHRDILQNKTKLKRNELLLFIDIAFAMMGTRYHYEHDFRALETYLVGLNVDNKFIAQLRKIFDTTVALHNECEKSSHNEYSDEQRRDELCWVHGVY